MKFILTLVLGVPLLFMVLMGTWAIVSFAAWCVGPIAWAIFGVCVGVALISAVLA